MEAEIATFAEDDAGYEAWTSKNGGYVLTSPRSGVFMLHDCDCIHLQRDGDITLTLTKKPRLCSRSRRALATWAEGEAGQKPLLCQSCM